jgi:sugar O-acyltransferase (sialic acid O-acetyltransferase NeuD family)
MYLYGASGHAKVIMDSLLSQGINIEGCIDDNPELVDLMGYPIMHQWQGQSPIIISIGINRTRRMVVQRLISAAKEMNRPLIFGQVMHSSAIISPSATIGEGTVVMQGAIVQTCSQIGVHCILNTGSSIDHECVIGDYVHISPHATLCGNVSIGEGTWVGAGSTVIQGVHIGRWCMIGAGSVVSKDIPDGYLAVGNRCKPLKRINQDLI